MLRLQLRFLQLLLGVRDSFLPLPFLCLSTAAAADRAHRRISSSEGVCRGWVAKAASYVPAKAAEEMIVRCYTP